jgi:hypothetical protein
MGTSARVAARETKDHVEPERLAEEQAALRRVATLVASGAPSADVFAAVAQEVERNVGAGLRRGDEVAQLVGVVDRRAV